MKTRSLFSTLSALLLGLVLVSGVRGQAELQGETLFGARVQSMLQDGPDADADLSAYDHDIKTAYQFFVEGNYQEAYRHLNYALKHDPNRPEAYLGFAMAARAQKQFATAERALRKGLEVAPDHPKVREELARLLLLKQTPEDALAEIDYAILLDEGKNWRTLEVRAETLIALDRLEESAEVYPRIIRMLEDNVANMRRTISREEAKGEITDMVTDVEVVRNFDGTVQEVEVTRIDTTPKVAPDEWYQLLDRLKVDLAEARQRLAEINAAIASS